MSFSTLDIPDLAGKTIVITGANSGIGYEAARILARKHARVVLACRSLERGHAAEERIRREVPGALLDVRELDLASLAGVRQFASQLMAAYPRLDVLINNAGLMALPHQTTADGFEMQLGVNHLGHFALTGLLLPHLLLQKGSRVVNVASQAHKLGRMRWDDLDGRNNYSAWGAYGQSKLANLLFTFELARRLAAKPTNVLSLACHPGYAATNLQYVGAQQTGDWLTMNIMRIGNTCLAQSAEGGALPTLFAAAALDARNGEYIGPSGLFGRAGSPAPLRATARAYDPDAMRKLWEISVERTGVRYEQLD